MSRLTDLLQRYASRHQPIDLRLLDSVIRSERFTGTLTLHYRSGQPKLLEAGKPIVVEVESPDASSSASADSAAPAPAASYLTIRSQ